jgi:hypothetical protein
MLCIFPFETEIYDKAGVASTYVGHPLASEIPLEPNTQQARENILNCFVKLWGKNSIDFEMVKLMTDSQLCLYWSRWFD